ncbi:hypothetical protein [uncultured Desulfuromonas sp.]|uniref:hypothetical protein n=1 Tax=uncultured Desulfuromonas sp. TaxID=181013 RepID=UPI002AAAC7E2|nr:hypothetical protein [uncultured Desulfuromonas sp.]
MISGGSSGAMILLLILLLVVAFFFSPLMLGAGLFLASIASGSFYSLIVFFGLFGATSALLGDHNTKDAIKQFTQEVIKEILLLAPFISFFSPIFIIILIGAYIALEYVPVGFNCRKNGDILC